VYNLRFILCPLGAVSTVTSHSNPHAKNHYVLRTSPQYPIHLAPPLTQLICLSCNPMMMMPPSPLLLQLLLHLMLRRSSPIYAKMLYSTGERATSSRPCQRVCVISSTHLKFFLIARIFSRMQAISDSLLLGVLCRNCV